MDMKQITEHEFEQAVQAYLAEEPGEWDADGAEDVLDWDDYYERTFGPESLAR